VLALLAFGATLHAQAGIRIVPLVRDGSLLISFSVAEAFTSDLKAVIQSGLRTTFTYTVDLRLEVPAWVDRTVASTVLSNSVQFDNLTRQHTVVRSFDGRVEDSVVTEDVELVKQLMTTFERTPLFRTSVLEPNREYYVRVYARARPSGASFVWPWNSGPSGLANFTFIP
jgi:hypothetical protein